MRLIVTWVPMNYQLYSISAAARLAGVHPNTIRRYERLGILTGERINTGLRIYDAEQIEAIRKRAEAGRKRPRKP